MTVHLTGAQTYFIIVDGSSATQNEQGSFKLDIARKPTQIDVTSLLTDDVIYNDGKGQDWSSQAIDSEGTTLPTETAALNLGGPTIIGVPDNGFFAGNEDHPDLFLHWSNDDNGPNARVVSLAPNGSVSFAVPAAHYHKLQIFGAAADGNANLTITLAYDDASTDIRSVTAIDWVKPMPGANQFFLLEHIARVQSALVVNNDASITGVNLDPSSIKVLKSVTISKLQSSSYYTFFGAVGY
jgi:hypothetical protein